MKVFYIRVSTTEQREDRQLTQAKEVGAEKIFIDKASGKDTNREEFKKMMDFVREGDTIYCSDFSRISRSTKDLLNIVEELKEKTVNFVSLKEQIDTTTPQGMFILTVFGALYQLDREAILQKQREGIIEAKKRGAYKGRQPVDIDRKKFDKYCEEWRAGERTAKSIYKAFGITSTTFYRKVNEWGLNK